MRKKAGNYGTKVVNEAVRLNCAPLIVYAIDAMLLCGVDDCDLSRKKKLTHRDSLSTLHELMLCSAAFSCPMWLNFRPFFFNRARSWTAQVKIYCRPFFHFYCPSQSSLQSILQSLICFHWDLRCSRRHGNEKAPTIKPRSLFLVFRKGIELFNQARQNLTSIRPLQTIG